LDIRSNSIREDAGMVFGEGRLIHDLLDEAAAEVPRKRAVRDASGEWTYRQLTEFRDAFTRWLSDRGVGRGDRVVLQLPSSREMVAMFYGTVQRGAVFVPLNPAMKPFHLRPVVENADPKLVITHAGGLEQLRGVTSVPVYDVAHLWAEVTELHTRGVPGEPLEPVSADDVATLIYTSGSTAAPKAVVCPHAQVVFASRALTRALGYRPDDTVFCRFPMSWDYGLYKVLMSCVARCEIVLADGESDFVLLKRMRETNVTVVPIVPSLATMIVSLARRDNGPRPPVRMFTNTGAALPRSTIAALRELFPGARVVRQYGQTEAKRITVMPPDEDQERPEAVGLPLPGTEVLILDAEHQPVPVGGIGEIVVSGPNVMPGYWRSPEGTARTFRRDEASGRLRLHTGDYGNLDADGYLYFQGRRDDMFKRKGLRMSTVEIESAALDIPGVRAAAALPPGETCDLALFVESDLSLNVIIKELMERLEVAKMPAICRVLSTFPLTLHGKNAHQDLVALLDGSDE
jgi:amino acid adenylation domain-containing protein